LIALWSPGFGMVETTLIGSGPNAESAPRQVQACEVVITVPGAVLPGSA
jgi:hypothetical protein